MRIATWNVNSIKARMPNVIDWLKSAKPDVLLLQELKCETGEFPRLEFEVLGYQALVVGQKAYNGVAILSLEKPEHVLERLPGDGDNASARYVEATIGGLRVASLYAPNGNPIDSEKFTYKLDWLARLKAHAQKLLEDEKPFVLGGDYNVIPAAEDVYDPEGWEQDALYHPKSRAAFRELLHIGLTDAFRALHPHQKHAATFWSYRAGAWQKDNGLRIDHFLLSPEAVDRLASCFIDRTPRGEDNASDHTPVTIVMG
ncbi:MAG: exodeoxyribonuclease III [Alphaproteobacteria bacterium]|nr:exodeoxyribonuclease III [Alphaproteobacteria bacterium]